HGANWTFVIWGALHGVYLVAENFLRKLHWYTTVISSKNIFTRILIAIVIFQLVVIGWIFFRAENVGDAVMVLGRILTFENSSWQIPDLLQHNGFYGMMWKIFLAFVFLMFDKILHNYTRSLSGTRVQHAMRLGVYGVLAAVILLFGFWGEVEFIYFQF
ncbi:MAG: hypothetical protein ACKVOR_11755, partial [Flavobacteriales bacterium]